MFFVEIYTKAKELADAIAASSELEALKEAELKMMMDAEARTIVEEYQTMQTEAMNSGINFEDLSPEEKEKVEAMENKMGENENITVFLAANQAFEQVLRSVNMIIGSAINGGGSDCGSCGSAGSCGSDSGSCGCGSDGSSCH